MKERKQITLILGITLTAAISIVGCKSKEKTITKELENRGEVEIVEHCSGESYFSNNKYFRANATGESLDRETAKKKALSNAMADLAKSVRAIMKIGITGQNGFLGQHLYNTLGLDSEQYELVPFKKIFFETF